MASCDDTPSPFSNSGCSGPDKSWDFSSRDSLTQGLHSLLAQSYSSWLIAGTLAIVLLSSITTRLRSGSRRASPKRLDGAKEPSLIPYWLPYLGSDIDCFWDKSSFLVKTRDYIQNGVFSIYASGSTRNVVWQPSLITSVFHKSKAADFEQIRWHTMTNVFDMSSSNREAYNSALGDLNALYHVHFTTELHSAGLLKAFVRNLESSVPDLVSFCASQIDQMHWERVSNVHVLGEGEGAYEFVDADFNELIRNFMGYMATPTLFGSAFMESYSEGDLIDDLLSFDSAMHLFSSGIPRWAPWPGITRAHIRRRKLLHKLSALQQALDQEATDGDASTDYGDLEDVSQLTRERHAVYKRFNLPLRARASSELALLWAMNVNSNAIVSWMLLRIYSTPGLLEELREEVSSHIHLKYPAEMLGFSVTPTLKIDVDALFESCLLLRSTFFETLRLHNQPTSVCKAKSDFVLSAPPSKTEGQESEDAVKYFIREGTWIDMPHVLHQTDPSAYSDPQTFKPDRFITHPSPSLPTSNKESEEKRTIEVGIMRPFGGGVSACKAGQLAEKQCLALVAGVIMAWEIEPLSAGGKWELPKGRATTAVMVPARDVRVRLRRRKPNAASA